MSGFEQLLEGFSVALTLRNLLLCLGGCFWGTLVGVLPGLGPTAGMVLLLPLTYELDPAGAIIMLAGIFYGTMYGGSTTSILMRIPGEAASVVTCIDGYEMSKRGRAGAALSIAATGSLIGGTLSILGLQIFAPLLADVMLRVGTAAEFMLMLTALLLISTLSEGPLVKTLAMIGIGIALSLVGLDPLTGWPRFLFGNMQLAEGINFAALAIGLFGVSEILLSFNAAAGERPRAPRLRELLPTRTEWRESLPAFGRGSLIGFAFGILPGVSHIVSTFVSYGVEKKFSPHPEQFGHGAVAGVAGPETANNATTGSAMIPLLVLGIPAIPATSILLAAFLIHGVQPGPLLLTENASIFWSLIASMYIGNVILLVLNLPLVGLFVTVLRTPFGYLAPLILLIALIGVYAVNTSTFDLALTLVAGVAGYFLRKFDYELAPLILAFVLGHSVEINFRRALAISDGDYTTFLSGPATLIFAAILAVTVVVKVWRAGVVIHGRRSERARELSGD